MTTVNRRTFLQAAGAQAGALVVGDQQAAHAASPRAQTTQAGATADVAVIGAGAFGGWTALYLREMGLSVMLIDAYGPGNARAHRAAKPGRSAPATVTGRSTPGG